MANNPTAITATIPATHLSISQLADMLLASMRETFPAATPMEIEDLTIPGTFHWCTLTQWLTYRGKPAFSTGYPAPIVRKRSFQPYQPTLKDL